MSEAYIVSYLNGIQTKMGASHFKKEVSKEPSLSKEPYYTVWVWCLKLADFPLELLFKYIHKRWGLPPRPL
jgi:hypothetical protein